jgi:hypothetical protein
MEYNKLKDEIIPQIKNYLHDWGVVIESYKDILNIFSLAEDISDNTKDDNFFKLIDEGKELQAFRLYSKQSQLITLLKSLYLLSNIFVDRLLIEITNDTEITLTKFVNEINWANKFKLYRNIDSSKILSTYCIVLFRHKLLAHHKVYRGEGAALNGKSSYLQFFGVSNNSTSFPQTEMQNVQKLKNKYSSNFNELSKLSNLYSISEFLFYNIPIGSIGKINPDRLLINSIVETCGVKSYDFEKIIDSIDEFLSEFARVLVCK